MAGRRPKPTKLRKLGGKAGHRALNDAEPAVPVEIPEMPTGLSEFAQAEWNATLPMLVNMGIISRVDGSALAAYCECCDSCFEAKKEVKRLGRIIEEPICSKTGEVIGYKRKANPAVAMLYDALKLMKSFLIEFGMTPAARSRLRVEAPDGEEPDPMEQFLRDATKLHAGKEVN
jgi:P27 family predicted phage terminase small subunit